MTILGRTLADVSACLAVRRLSVTHVLWLKGTLLYRKESAIVPLDEAMTNPDMLSIVGLTIFTRDSRMLRVYYVWSVRLSACPPVRLSVRPSVCPPHCCIVSKRCKL